ncbi:DUF6894 family protein [Roseomonas sp. BN140053]|uniref:DUF6894 family protein n=1 Tax=Roseomonas sp. BN140053 TaxID=3391898 RepID=UPI0039E9A3C5
MPQFFFDVHDSQSVHRDTEGQDLATHRDACREAMALLPDLARDLPATDSGRDLYAVVRDEAGREFFRATLSLEGDWLD